MKTPNIALPPPLLLAIAYSPSAVRPRLTWLLALDQRLSDVLTRASEPIIAQLRLSWWRDALKSEPDDRPKGEPLLADLNKIEHDDALILAGLSLVDAFEILATQSDLEAQSAARAQRISAICDAYARWAGCAETNRNQITEVARLWSNTAGPLPKSLPRILRPLSILALAERLANFEHGSTSLNHGLRLNWHAFTGR